MDIRYLIYAWGSSILFFIYLYLSYLVIIQRRKYHVLYLTNDDKAFIARFRAHANFAEYVPLTLILMGMSIILQIPPLLLAILMFALIIARLGHAYGLIKKEAKKQFKFRIYSVATTFIIMGILAIFNVSKATILYIVI
ncbi:TPA: MAPEG family protein [Legionella pneumophila]|uniref:MAPEG family protein n=1 Tax=Legionella pneumophila TaxID=446 RepID=UPI000493C3FA|nr:MAPEG family protein [Legionella pneumophila]HAT8850394.1 glutathione S-transferase [Legionella pneumophila subsp. pneumophila]MCO1452237.1 MAPEG family protein [Legionella pneumophila]MCW8402902.1 MAPEG family protein [Legionella pneumophila]MCW8457943.1 MAPEG family protein [Legionella pneumophila]MCW8477575.1 MAPEG family protein [Legionella pneumophila]